MLPNIGLAGRAGSGKGVLAAELVKRGYHVVSFARALKIDVGRMFLDEDTHSYEALAWVGQHKDTLRPLLQAYGVAVRDIKGANFWINIALRVTQAYNELGTPVVIDDLRFPNEVGALKRAGFVTFRIERPDWHRHKYGGPTLEGDQAQHSSESQIDDLPIDWVLQNDGRTETLFNRLAYAVNYDRHPASVDLTLIYSGVNRG